MSNILFPYAHLVGKHFYHPRRYFGEEPFREPVELVVVAVEKGATDYLRVAKENDLENTRSMWAIEVEPLVLLYDLYNVTENLFMNIVDAEEHIHPSHGYVLSDVALTWRELDKIDAWLNGRQFEPTVDQYDERVPEDLVTLPNVADAYEMYDSGHEPYVVTDHMDWYEVRGTGLLLAPLHQVPPNYREFFGNMDDYGFGTKFPEVDFVAKPLRRYNEKDGFYHA